MSPPKLTHIGADGAAQMVDVGAKPPTERRARARACLRMSPSTAALVQRGDAPKGDVLGTARLAGIQAAKRTFELIPLAHPIALTNVDVRASINTEAGTVELVAQARTVGRTGVEMEAMTACAVAALAVYDMVKGIERGVEIEQVALLEKSGGVSDPAGGPWRRKADGAAIDPRLDRESPGISAPEHRHLDRTPSASQLRHEPQMATRAALITISTSKATGEGDDESGRELAALARRLGVEVAVRELIGDDRELIEARLRHLADVERCELVLTSGGTGMAGSDLTPEATRAVIEREAPGIAEAMRAASRPHTPHWMLSRGVAGIRGQTLIVNFPGSPQSIAQAAEGLLEALPHALALIAGGGDHVQGPRPS